MMPVSAGILIYGNATHRIPARIPLNPAPMTITLIGLYSSIEKLPKVNLPS